MLVCVSICVCGVGVRVLVCVCLCVLSLKSVTRHPRSSLSSGIYVAELVFCLFVWTSITAFCFTFYLKLHHLISSKQRFSFLINYFICYLVPFLLSWQSHIEDGSLFYKAFFKQTNLVVDRRQSVDRTGLFLRLKVAFIDYINALP